MDPQFHRQILEAGPDAVVALDPDERVIEWNARAEAMFGWPAAEAIGASFPERCVTPRCRPDFERALYRNMRVTQGPARAGRRAEIRGLRRDGSEFPIEITVAPLGDGKERRFAAFIRDLTEQQGRLARAAIDSQVSRLLGSASDRETVERRLLEIVCAADGWDMGCFWRARGNRLACVAIQQGQREEFSAFRDASLAFRPAAGQGLPGRVLEEGHPRWFTDLSEEGDAGRADALSVAGLRTAVCFPVRLGTRVFGICEFLARSERPCDGDLMETFASLAGSIALFFKQKEAEAALRESEERFRLLIENSSDGIAVFDRAGHLIYGSPAAERLSGFSKDVLMGMRVLDLVHPEDLADFNARMEPVYGAPGARASVTFRIRHKEGAWRWIESRAANHMDDPRIGGILSNFRDVTEEHEAKLDRELLLARLEIEAQRLGRLLDLLPIPVLLEEPGSGDVRFANQAAARLARESGGGGAPEGSAPASASLFAFTDPEGRPLTEGDAPGSRAARGETLANVEVGLPGPKGRRSLLVNSAVLAGQDGTPEWVVLAFLDITEQKHVETQLRHSQKVEAVGQLAGGIAHDFNNLLTAINGYAEMAKEAAQEGSPMAMFVREIAKAGERASALTGQLLTFSRKRPVETKRWDFNEIVGSMEPMLLRLIAAKARSQDAAVRVTVRLSPVPLPVRVDRGMVEQVVMNLALNARDAMPSGGSLEITLGMSKDSLEDPILRIEPPAAAYAVLEVSDTGSGMTPEVKARIFEPFFTTKESGKGTGLGLSVVFGAVRQCRGAISLESEPGKGTRFKVAFALEAPPAPAPEIPPRPEEEVAEALQHSA